MSAEIAAPVELVSGPVDVAGALGAHGAARSVR